MNLNTNS